MQNLNFISLLKKNCMSEINDIEKQLGKLSQNQVCALASLIYNIGSTSFARSKCKKCIISGNITGACKNWDWFKSNGKILNGLIKRRNLEINYFMVLRIIGNVKRI